MAQDTAGRDQPVLRYRSGHPNFPDVSGTSLPLLSTVLAGFAVTNIVQLVIRPDVADDLPPRVVTAVIALLVSLLLFLGSTVLSINAQANNYLPFIDPGPNATRIFGVDQHGDWLTAVERRWYVYHSGAIYSFYGGVLLLLAGVNLTIWFYVGGVVASVFLAGAILTLVLSIVVARLAERAVARP